MPVAIKKQGRSKGHTSGLPCKKGRKNLLCAFSRLHMHTFKKKKVCTDPFNILFKLFLYAVILNWFVDKIVVQDAFDGKLIEEEQIEYRPEKSQIQFYMKK